MLVYDDLTKEEEQEVLDETTKEDTILSCGKTSDGHIYYYLLDDAWEYERWHHGDAGTSYHTIKEDI